MDIVQHRSDDVQKRALAALMFTGALQGPLALKKHNPILLHHGGQFQIVHKGKLSKIPSLNIKGLKSKLSAKQFKGFVENGGYFWLSKDNNDDFCLEAKMRLIGGGYATGEAAYWGTKAVGWGAYAVFVFFHPYAVGELHVIGGLIESGAQVARGIGYISPSV